MKRRKKENLEEWLATKGEPFADGVSELIVMFSRMNRFCGVYEEDEQIKLVMALLIEDKLKPYLFVKEYYFKR